jgi:subtilisin-like proprotein convertase family protein/subtilisin family serine protease
MACLVVMTLTWPACLVLGQLPARVEFKEPQTQTYTIEWPQGIGLLADRQKDWVPARAEGSDPSAPPVELGSRVVLQLKPGTDVNLLLEGSRLQVDRTVAPDVYILQAPGTRLAVWEAQRLAQEPEVLASSPVMRRYKQLDGYSRQPNDPYFPGQWHLENRDSQGHRTGADLNVREAWPWTRGQGVIIGMADDGIDMDHPDLAPRLLGAPHFNFESRQETGAHTSPRHDHGTAVAGIAVAEKNNDRGIVGVAPEALLASWVIFSTNQFFAWNGYVVEDEQLMDMFQYQSDRVGVQNHSWGSGQLSLVAPSLLENIGISNAVTFGRGGRGSVMVRSAGNERDDFKNVNEDGYPSDPRVIAVGAVLDSGRVTSYSNPGAALLVSAPGGDQGSRTIFTTDRMGSLGNNRWTSDDNDLADYAFDDTGFIGTSASAPQIAGVAALILSANPDLTYRDVQQILLLSARHFDLEDPDLARNGAGLWVSHNVGFGIPDAGEAVRLARLWTSRPPLEKTTVEAGMRTAVPDDGLRILVDGQAAPDWLRNLRARSGLGVHPDAPTASLPLAFLGRALEPVQQNLTGKAALIERGINFFSEKIQRAADAGAAFAIIHNNQPDEDLVLMANTDFLPIPAVFIRQSDGEALRDLIERAPETQAQLHLNSAEIQFEISETLLCEHVALRLKMDHPRRGDLRVTLVSPQGTRSVLQSMNLDASSGPRDWTYHSTRHFFESSAGTWTLHVSDQIPGYSGHIEFASLTVMGTPIVDSDRDGLDDHWEMAHFNSLDQGPLDDPDGDGFQNAREQVMGTNPNSRNLPFEARLSFWNDEYLRLSWPSTETDEFQVRIGPTAAGPFTLSPTIPGAFPRTEWFTPINQVDFQFFQIRKKNRAGED